MTAAEVLPDQEHVLALADDLIRALTPHAGDPEAVSGLLRHWLDVLDVPLATLVCCAAVRRTFADCLTMCRPAPCP